MCDEFRINPYKSSTNKKTYLTLEKECGEPYPELSLKEQFNKTFQTSDEEYRINKNILGLYDDSDRPKNYYPSHFLTSFKSMYNPASKNTNKFQMKNRKKYKSLVDLNLKTSKSVDKQSIKVVLPELSTVYPSTDPLKYHPLTQVPDRQEADGFITSWTKYLWGSKSEDSLDEILQFSRPKPFDLKKLFNEIPYKLFERRRKSLLIRQEFKLSKNSIDLCLENVNGFGDFKFTSVKTIDSPYITEIHIMINDALNRSFIPNGRYSSGSIVCKGFIIHLQEQLDGNFIDKLDTMSEIEKQITLCQLLLTLTILQGQYGILHGNITPKNIEFLNIKPSDGYFKYKIAGRTFYLPNIGYLAIFVGFDHARILNPMYGIDQYRGIRNIHVTSDSEPFWGNKAGNELTVELIKTKYLPILDDNYNYTTYKRNDTDQNIFIDGFDSVPVKTVDLADMRAYPAFDFKTDITDLIKIFPNNNYVLDDLRAILPDLAAAILFPQFSTVQLDIIEEFRWP